MNRKTELRSLIAAAERRAAVAQRELERLEELPDFGDFQEGSIVAIQVTWPSGRRSYTYVAIKAGGDWFVTGQQGSLSDDGLTEFLVANRRTVTNIQLLAIVDNGAPARVDLGSLLGMVLVQPGDRD